MPFLTVSFSLLSSWCSQQLLVFKIIKNAKTCPQASLIFAAPFHSAVPGRFSSSRSVLETDSTTVFLSPSLIPSSIFVVDGLHLRLFISTVGALSRPSNGDNRPSIPSHPSTYRSDCSKPLYGELKQTPDQTKA